MAEETDYGRRPPNADKIIDGGEPQHFDGPALRPQPAKTSDTAQGSEGRLPAKGGK
jgi:hypothetical protein